MGEIVERSSTHLLPSDTVQKLQYLFENLFLIAPRGEMPLHIVVCQAYSISGSFSGILQLRNC